MFMTGVLGLYRANRVKELESKKDKDIIAIKCEDATYKALREAKKALRGDADATVSLRGYVFSKEINERINAVRETFTSEIAKLDDFLREVSAMLNLADTTEKRDAVLKLYGIYNSKNRVA